MPRGKGYSEINYIIMLQTFLLGALLAEGFVLLITVGEVLREKYIVNSHENWLWLIFFLYLFLLYRVLKKSSLAKLKIFVKSKRLDLLITLVLGVVAVLGIGSIGTNYVIRLIQLLSWSQLQVLMLIPIGVFIALFCREYQLNHSKKEEHKSFFLSDKAGEDKNDDKFGFSNQAESFAEKVFNNNSSESLVFGIDAPWGTGKSTFVNLCKVYWKEKHGDEMIVYSFNSLCHKNKDELLKKFIAGLIEAVNEKLFVPEIEPLVSKYAKLLQNSQTSISCFGLSFSLPLLGESTDKVFKQLEIALQNMDKKTVIIVDDLDRLDFSAIIEVLFVVKKSFNLPNISYVICYDTENVGALGQGNIDKEKINEFFEKFINVKTGIYLDNKMLLEYFIANKDSALSDNNILANIGLVSKVTEGLRDIFASNDFHMYLPFIGDARKIKRLINTIIMLEGPENDLEDYDFDKQDLTHLLLIYLNYPNIFRKIYNAESKGKRGLFSLVSKYDVGYPQPENSSKNNNDGYKNSVYYEEYLKTLTDNQKFILDKVFKRLSDGKATESMRANYACFNEHAVNRDGNLERYLNLLIKMTKPLKTGEYNFYNKLKNSILKGTTIEEVFGETEFTKSEENQKQLWIALVNAAKSEFEPEKAKEIINYALDELPKYSLVVNNKSNCLRENLTLYIVKLLDKVGWVDENNKYINNTDENVSRIAQWIFGEGAYENKGILEILGDEKRGVPGIYDLLSFRLNCCHNRSGDIFDLASALLKHESKDAKIDGLLSSLVIPEMREMSQSVFKMFKSRFIDKNRNIFDEIESLTLAEIVGVYSEEKEYDISTNERDKILARVQHIMRVFIIYQLGSKEAISGIGCGYYDLIGKEDKGEISTQFNDYLFKICFNPLNSKAYKYFVRYLMDNFLSANGFLLADKSKPQMSSFLKVLEKNKLIAYWRSNGIEIKKINLEQERVTIDSYEHALSYQEYVGEIYNLLDEESENEIAGENAKL